MAFGFALADLHHDEWLGWIAIIAAVGDLSGHAVIILDPGEGLLDALRFDSGDFDGAKNRPMAS